MVTRAREFWRGVRAEAPILLSVIPFGLFFGALAVEAGISIGPAQGMSAIIFAGASQLLAVQLIAAGSSSLVMLLVIFVVNLRHALYSASVAPHLKPLSRGWKMLLAYLLTDEAYAVAIMHYNRQDEEAERKHWFFLGAGITLWTAWQISTAAGLLIGAQIPADWPLTFVLPLTFIALVVPVLKDKASIASAVSAAVIGLLAVNLPFKTGLLAASLVGILAGVLLEGKTK
jgi:4-azaleucine resistance transporter AzlC